MQRLSTLNKLKSAKDIDPQSAKELIVSINLDDISALEQVRSENNVGFSHFPIKKLGSVSHTKEFASKNFKSNRRYHNGI